MTIESLNSNDGVAFAILLLLLVTLWHSRPVKTHCPHSSCGCTPLSVIYFISVLVAAVFILSVFAIKSVLLEVNLRGHHFIHVAIFIAYYSWGRKKLNQKACTYNFIRWYSFSVYMSLGGINTNDLKFTTYLKMNRECLPSSGSYSNEIPLPRSSQWNQLLIYVSK